MRTGWTWCKALTATSALGLLVVAGPVAAQSPLEGAERDMERAGREARQEGRQAGQEIEQGTRQAGQDMKEGARETKQEAREAKREAQKEAREAKREGREEAREAKQEAREAKQDSGLTAEASDAWITTKLKASLIGDDRLEGSDISVDTENDGVVTLTGTAPSEDIKQRAGDVARSVEGVRKVNNVIRVKTSR